MRPTRVVLLAALCLPLASCFNTADNQAQGAFVSGKAALAAGDFSGADARFSAALRFEPAFAKAYGGRARARVALGRLDEASADLDRQEQLEPAACPPAFLVYRAAVRAALKEHDAALADCVRALETEPQNDEARRVAGHVHWSAGRRAQARPELEEAARLNAAWRPALEEFEKGGEPGPLSPEALRKSAAALPLPQ